MLSLRKNLRLYRLEFNNKNKTQVDYNIEYKEITEGPFLSEDNYDINRLIDSSHK